MPGALELAATLVRAGADVDAEGTYDVAGAHTCSRQSST